MTYYSSFTFLILALPYNAHTAALKMQDVKMTDVKMQDTKMQE